ncbi:GTPase-activating protein CdGAPr [Anopheles bellator]|uniref:GTPase-activating protein CdGAPr n=1 Tax=Anopheles bellator TaxID=139047 RepID=UPI00264A1D38|nr:GTPase-activating protein CdGAPr [Anopheles bellator]
MSQIMRKDSSISAASHRQHHRSIDIGGGVGESSIVERDRGPPRSAPPTSGGAKMAAVLEKPRTISDSESEINYDLFNTSVHSDSGSVVMNASQLSTTSCESAAVHIKSANLTRSQNASNGSCRFPKLEECAHFHYERVQLGNLSVQLEGDEGRSDSQLGLAPSDLNASQAPSLANSMTSGPVPPRGACGSNLWFIIRVTAGRSDPFMIKRSFENMCFLDEMLHRCVYDRRVSELENLRDGPPDGGLGEAEQLERMVGAYLVRLSVIASDAMTCGPVLTWLQIDNKGRRLPVADEQTMRCINTPAVGAAYGVRRYVAQACDEISIEVGDMISVIDMPSPAESIWWRGKKSHLQKNQYEVGFFPQSCVATIGDKVPRHMPFPAPLVGSLAVSPTKPVLRKHGKLIAFFRSFILSRPSRRRLKQSGIYRERVFSCDLGEHLLNSGQDIPMVLKCCAEFIEEYGIVDGIYRLSGITSNIQKLRRAFDEERIPDLAHPDIRQDIHAVSSLLKMYFRELPNPLCTYQLYDHFVEAIQTRPDAPTDLKLRLIRQTVQKLPPPHYRTLKYLATHLFKISRHSANTGMTERNIAIVWAPNLLRSPALESGGVAALRGVGVQAVVTEYLISNCEQIFDDTADDFGSHYVESQPNSLSDSNSVQNYAGSGGEQQDLSLTMSERPKSLSGGGAKLLSLEEARIRRNCVEQSEKTVPINIGTSTHIGSYIEVGGGPSSLPDKYHTVLPVPRSWNKRKSHSSWKSIFTRQPRQSNSNTDIKAGYGGSAAGGRASGEKGAPMVMVLPSVADASGAASLDESKDDEDDRRRSVSIKESSSGLLDKMAKSLLFSSGVDLFDGKNLAIDSSCMRSNSVDSLRTAGHSRSVSHDSYFDLLQSPMRGGTGTASGNNGAGAVTCPSRELSELGLNFDREEPEMRIFSESESLVSSPKVVKESVRRTLRARPEDYVGSGNSVNPSPKKQPRLNIPSPSEANKQWGACESSTGQQQDDESLCKRYKLEDQLSDIQFIDCNTPEHTVIGGGGTSGAGSAASSAGMMNTIFTSAQVHKPPRDDRDDQEGQSSSVVEMVGLRNSYPGTQYGYVKFDTSPIKETRFSYPGSGAKGKKEDAQNPGAKVQSMNVDEHPQPATASPVLKKNESSLYESFLLTSGQSKPPKYPGRYSYHQPVTATAAAAARADGGADGELVPRSSSENLLRRSATESLSQAHHHHHHHHHHHPSSHHHHHHGHSKQNTPSAPSSKQQLGVVAPGGPGTPQSPGVPSPCYSLLIGSTSSTDTTTDTTTTTTSNGPGDGTPVYDEMDIAGALVTHLELQNSKECGPLPTPAPKPSSKRSADLKAMKRELSLDLSGASNSKLTASNFTSDNTTTNTTNTSQSMTPSDFAYQNLHPDLSPNGATVQADGSAAAAPVEMATFGQKPKPGTPIKATINITYNVRSPVRKEQEGNLFAITPPTTPREKPSRGSMMMGHEEELIDEEAYRRERRSIYENVLVPAVDKDEREKESAMATPEAVAVAGAEAKRLLETNFDETMVYEQVKLLKNVVSEVNHLVRQDEPLPRDDRPHEVPELGCESERADESARSTEEDGLNNNATVACGSVKAMLHCCEDESLDSSGPVASAGGTVVMEEESEDVPMSDVNEDSLEFDNTDDLSLYENVELRKKNTFPVYENVSQGRQPVTPASTGTFDGQTDTTAPKSALLTDNDDEFSSLCADRSDLDNEMEYRIEVAPKIELSRESPTQNVSVKQLATKFETSPVEAVAPPFDFGATRGVQHQFRSSLTSGASDRVVFRNKGGAANGAVTTGGGKDGTGGGGAFASFTRSLDENAFVREFGSGRRLEGYVAGLTKSIAQISEVEKNILNENNPNRRKSLELNAGGRPRSLNQPKKLPPLTGGGSAGSPTGVENVDISQSGGETDGGKGTKPQLGSECCRVVKGIAGGYKHQQSGASLGNQDPTANMKLDLSTKIEDTKEARAYNVRITPTTENRISLVQYNYAENDREANMINACDGGEPVLVRATGRRRDESVSEEERHSSGLKMLGSCKLDRSRIEKIKEERRHQLNEKYRSESFKGERDYGGAGGKAKSKSKSELREFKEGDVVADRGDKKYDSLRFRSKSRAELLSSDGLFGGLLEGSANPGLLGSVSLNTVAMAQNTTPTIVALRPVPNNRTRRISDEKNQNDIPPPPVVVGTVAIGTSAGSPTNNGGGPISDATISQVCDNKFELKTRQKFDKRSSMDYPPAGPTDGQQKEQHRETPRNSFNNGGGVKAQVIVTRSNSNSTQRDRCSPPISIKDVAAMFESRSQQNQS